MKKILIAFAYAAFVLAPPQSPRGTAAQEGSKSIPVTVREPGFALRADWPVTGGVPFARGALWGKDVRLLGSTGKPVPLQTEVLARWPDGSTKWLLLDFTTNLKKGETGRYTLEPGAGPGALTVEDPLTVTETEEEVTVDTGAIRLAVPKKRGGILRQVWRGREEMLSRPADLTVVDEMTGEIPYNAENYL